MKEENNIPQTGGNLRKTENQVVSSEESTIEENTVSQNQEQVFDVNNISHSIEKNELPTIEIENQVEESTPSETVPTEDSVEPTSNFSSIQMEDVPRVEKKKGNYTILIVVAAILLFIIGMIYFIFNNSKNLFLSSINKEYGNIVSKINSLSLETKYKDAKNSSIVEKGNISFHVDVASTLLDTNTKSLIEEINKLNGTFVTGIDYKNKKIASNIAVQYDQKEMLGFNIYGAEKNVYVDLKNMFEKYISIPVEEYDSLFEDPSVTLDDAEYMMKSVKDAFLNSLESKDFKKSSATIKLGNKEEKVNKISYVLDSKNVNKITKKMLEQLEKDNTFIELVSKYTNKTKEQIKSTVQTAKNKDVITSSTNEQKVTFAVYTKGFMNEAVGYEICEDSSKTTIRYTKEGNDIYIRFSEQDKEIAQIVWNDKNANEDEISLTAGTVVLKLTVKKENEQKVIDYSLSESSSNLKAYGSLVSKITKNNSQYTGSDKLTANVDMQGVSMIKLNLETNYTSTIGSEVTIPTNLSNSITMNELTDTDTQMIMQNLMQNPVFVQFMTNIQKYINADRNQTPYGLQ